MATTSWSQWKAKYGTTGNRSSTQQSAYKANLAKAQPKTMKASIVPLQQAEEKLRQSVSFSTFGSSSNPTGSSAGGVQIKETAIPAGEATRGIETPETIDLNNYEKELTGFAQEFGVYSGMVQEGIQDMMLSTGQIFDIYRPELKEQIKTMVEQGQDISSVVESGLMEPKEFTKVVQVKKPELYMPSTSFEYEAVPKMEGQSFAEMMKRKEESTYPKSYEGEFSHDFTTGFRAEGVEDPNQRNLMAIDQVGTQSEDYLLGVIGQLDFDNMNSGEALKMSLLLELKSQAIENKKMNDYYQTLVDRTNKAYMEAKNLAQYKIEEVDRIIDGEELIPTTYEGLVTKVQYENKKLQLESVEMEKEYLQNQYDIWQKGETEKRARLEGYLKAKLYGMGAQDSSAGLTLIALTANQADLRMQMQENEYKHGLAQLNMKSREIMQNYTNQILEVAYDIQSKENTAYEKRESDITKILDDKFLNDSEKEKLQTQVFKDFFTEMSSLKEKQEQRNLEIMKFNYEQIQDARDNAYKLSGLMGTYFYYDPVKQETISTGIPTFEAEKWKNSYMLDVAEFEHKQQYDSYNYALDLANLDLKEREFQSSNLFKTAELQLEKEKFEADTNISMFELDLKTEELDMAYKKDMVDLGFKLSDYGVSGDEIASATGLNILKGITSPENIKTKLFEIENEIKIAELDYKEKEHESKLLKDKYDMGIQMLDRGMTPQDIVAELGLPSGFFQGAKSAEEMKTRLNKQFEVDTESLQDLEDHRANLVNKQLQAKEKAVDIALKANGNESLLRAAEQIAGLDPGSLDGLSEVEVEKKVNNKFMSDMFMYEMKNQLIEFGAKSRAAGNDDAITPIKVAYADGYKEDGLECGVFLHKFFDIPPMGDTLASKIGVLDNVLFGGAVQKGVERSLPQVGDLLILDVGTGTGHVAVVNAINSDSTRTLTEANYKDKWTVSNDRRISMTDPRIKGIHRGDLKPEYKTMLDKYEGILGEAVIDWGKFSAELEYIRQGGTKTSSEISDLREWASLQGGQIQQAVDDAILAGSMARSNRNQIQLFLGGSNPYE